MRTVFLQSSRLVSVVLFMLYGMSMFAQRQDILLNNDWNFRFSHQVQKGTEVRVDLPHTWNAQDALSGKIDYKRGIGNYEKNLFIRPEWKGKRLFIRFEGVNNIADVFVNRRHIGEHRGGYGAFIFEITGKVEYGKENSILVRVNNGEQLDIMPLVGDFNFYGGIYRDVHLLVTDEICISPLDYASPGVRLIQDSVSHKYAKVRAVVDLSNGGSSNREVELNVRLLDGQRVVKEGTKKENLSGNAAMQQDDRGRFSFAPAAGHVGIFVLFHSVFRHHAGIRADHLHRRGSGHPGSRNRLQEAGKGAGQKDQAHPNRPPRLQRVPVSP